MITLPVSPRLIRGETPLPTSEQIIPLAGRGNIDVKGILITIANRFFVIGKDI